MEDKKITCCDCKKEFVWTVKDQQFFKDNKIDKGPIRCRDCAIVLFDKRKNEKDIEEKSAVSQQNKSDAQSSNKTGKAPRQTKKTVEKQSSAQKNTPATPPPKPPAKPTASPKQPPKRPVPKQSNGNK